MGMLRWTIGGIRITQIIETSAGSIIEEILPDIEQRDLEKLPWLYPYFADREGKLHAVVQAFLLETGSDVILIDPCVGNGKPRKDMAVWNNLQTGFLSALESFCGSVDAVTKVFCTHLHFDHIGWNTRWDGMAWVPTFPSAEYLLTTQEFDYWKSVPEAEIDDDRVGFTDSILPVYEAGLVRLVSTDEKIARGVRLIPTPGHTPGHVSVVVEADGESAVITGDAIHHPCQIAHPEWRNIADTIPEKGHETRTEFIRAFGQTSTLVIGTHFSQPTAGRIVLVDGEYRFDVSGVSARDTGVEV
jgi:glyoxylase-like metal-dependent hydrolase (beta-lactamase superfamily II)